MANATHRTLKMRTKKLKIISRTSMLALWQAEHVKTKLLELYPDLAIEIKGIKTKGDQLLDIPLTKIGGKGLFVNELREALRNGDADIAVHSLKDMPATLDPEFKIAAILERVDARDVLVSPNFTHVDNLPANARIGTSSLRRQSQLLVMRSDLQMLPLRGNVDTRLSKLKNGQFEAIILAAAGLKRLNLSDHIRYYFTPDEILPAIGQGALAIECRSGDLTTEDTLQPLHHLPTAYCVLAERALSEALGGSCDLPLAGLATLEGEKTLKLTAKICSPDGKEILSTIQTGSHENSTLLGKIAAKVLLEKGAERIINLCKS